MCHFFLKFQKPANLYIEIMDIEYDIKKETINCFIDSLKTESSAQDDSEKNESTTEDNISNFNTIANIKSSKKLVEMCHFLLKT